MATNKNNDWYKSPRLYISSFIAICASAMLFLSNKFIPADSKNDVSPTPAALKATSTPPESKPVHEPVNLLRANANALNFLEGELEESQAKRRELSDKLKPFSQIPGMTNMIPGAGDTEKREFEQMTRFSILLENLKVAVEANTDYPEAMVERDTKELVELTKSQISSRIRLPQDVYHNLEIANPAVPYQIDYMGKEGEVRDTKVPYFSMHINSLDRVLNFGNPNVPGFER